MVRSESVGASIDVVGRFAPRGRLPGDEFIPGGKSESSVSVRSLVKII